MSTSNTNEDGESSHGSFRNEQFMARLLEEEADEDSCYANKPQTVIEALSYLLGHYDWQAGRESGG